MENNLLTLQKPRRFKEVRSMDNQTILPYHGLSNHVIEEYFMVERETIGFGIAGSNLYPLY